MAEPASVPQARSLTLAERLRYPLQRIALTVAVGAGVAFGAPAIAGWSQEYKEYQTHKELNQLVQKYHRIVHEDEHEYIFARTNDGQEVYVCVDYHLHTDRSLLLTSHDDMTLLYAVDEGIKNFMKTAVSQYSLEDLPLEFSYQGEELEKVNTLLGKRAKVLSIRSCVVDGTLRDIHIEE